MVELMEDLPELRLDRTKLRIVRRIEDSVADELEYWRNTTTKERLQHIERLRRLNYGTRATEGLQRVIRLVKC